MSSKAMSLKGKIKNYAKSKSIAAQVVCRIICSNDFLQDCQCQTIVRNLL